MTPPLPKTVLKKITVGDRISPASAIREAEKRDNDAYYAHLDGREIQARKYRQQARALRQVAQESN